MLLAAEGKKKNQAGWERGEEDDELFWFVFGQAKEGRNDAGLGGVRG